MNTKFVVLLRSDNAQIFLNDYQENVGFGKRVLNIFLVLFESMWSPFYNHWSERKELLCKKKKN